MKPLSVLLATLFAVAVAVPAMTADAPTGGWVGFDAVADRDAAAPSWADVTFPERLPGCTGRTDAGLADRVVILEDGDVERWTFGQVADSDRRFWVVGSCDTRKGVA